MNAHQQHLDKCVRESVPTALEHVGMAEVAEKFRALPEINGAYRIERARAMLQAVLPELMEAGKGLEDVIEAGSKEVAKEAAKYRSGLMTARALVEAAKTATGQALRGGAILN